ncbi:Peroxisome biosynthesis protein pex1 [Lambiella insularis]|nr:Peroxisome biosynthesis protein pex1 [Lambiella insularis]
MALKRTATTAEVGLIQLRNCLVNLPALLVAALVNSNTAVQNVVVELQYRSNTSSSKGHTTQAAQQSIYVGWTGLGSQRRHSPSIGRGLAKNRSTREQDVGFVELDATFGRMLGLSDGQRVGVLVHLDPPVAHTVNIEPLTPADWEIIELHATFLEVNLVAQIRALPNPSFTGLLSTQAQIHPLTLHLSPTSTANIIITSLAPPLASSIPFAKLAPDAEIIVAPKSRPRLSRNQRTESRSSTSVGQRSNAGNSSSGLSRRRSRRDERSKVGRVVFLRGLSRTVSADWFDSQKLDDVDTGLKVWVDPEVLKGRDFAENESLCVSIVEPASLRAPLDPQQQQRVKDQENSEVGKATSKVVARVMPWDDAPDARHVVLSSLLCSALGIENMAGGIVKLQTPPIPIASSAVLSLKLYPFTQAKSRHTEGLRFGGETKASREAAAEKIWALFGGNDDSQPGLLRGSITDGLVLPKCDGGESAARSWNGGLLRFHPPPRPAEGESAEVNWLRGDDEVHTKIEIQHETTNPFNPPQSLAVDAEQLSLFSPALVGVDDLVSGMASQLLHRSSVLLNGGLGSGKTSTAQAVGYVLRQKHLYHVSHFPCRKLMTDETRVSSIKETFHRLFLTALWAAQLGGNSLVILDDLDRICPAETELQVGGENGRSRQLSELVCSMVRQYCGADSGVNLLITAQAKDALHSVIVGGHVVREIVDLKAPNRDARRRVLESLAEPTEQSRYATNGVNDSSPVIDHGGWMNGSPANSRPHSAGDNGGFILSRKLDLLEVAAHTDGYMPGDLVLLLSRARSEALIRSAKDLSDLTTTAAIQLVDEDFKQALEGFTPASLRNVTLQTSSTTFDSIGGLHATRRILLETLQYPTTYAPIFEQCPLRLRSGLLLYGYPGCGKTLLASAVAGECGLNFISVKGPEILNKYIGASEKSVRDLFERAEAARPCVLFFDEFDSIAPKRGHDSTGVTDRVVNQLLTQMDGAEGLSGVYVLAATSRPDLIDPALLRPGRLDKSLLCDLPDLDDRLDILRALSKKLKIDSNLVNGHGSRKDFIEIAHRTEGYSGADLQAVIYNAHLEAIHDVLGDHKGSVTMTNGSKAQQKISASVLSTTLDILQFRFGEDEDRLDAADRASSGINRSKQSAERAAFTAKLDAVKQARRKERALRHGTIANDRQEKIEELEKNPEVVIQWKHIEASLATTRSSVSADERLKLRSIYREFQVGRSGDMPSGQGGMEIGGRSSLM